MVVDLADLRARFGTGPSDDALETAILAAYESLDEMYGPFTASVTEHLRPYGQWVDLSHRASAVSEVIEGTTTLDPADYTIWPGGRSLRRLTSGDPTAWLDWIDVTYTRMSMDAERDRVAIALVDLDVNRPTSGLTSITVGPWSEHYGTAEGQYAKDREAILRSYRQAAMGTR